ncbi:hypothetical protein LTR56_015572 [Elasticomyces elasticus]|nr:hypothetical protein LTR56_015572 [Elasticomyces elasticus]KAK3648279.1 hypothetical protein LTR22_013410 [Elasticomyces elasticus]KAK4903064.1 hypothetical protein LTR49_026888 [Elasticomyces elasticus]KAK5737275.1 hypothetical protein LTS12_025945 [Elasticomyces elasticus]
MSSIDLEAQANVDNQAGHNDEMQVETTPAATDLERKDVPAALMAKRKATSTLEPEQTKKPKASSEASEIGEESNESVSRESSSPDLEELPAETATRTADAGGVKKRRTEAEVLKDQAATIKRLRFEVSQAEKQDDVWRHKYCTLETEVEELKAQKTSRASGNTINKRIEQSIKDDYKGRMEAQREQLEAKHKADLKSKQTSHQKNIEELKTKHESDTKAKDEVLKKKSERNIALCIKRVDAAKEREKEAKNELANEKKEMTEYKKELKKVQQGEINKFKPAHSATVKEKDEAIKALIAEKAALEDEVKKHKKNVDMREQEISSVTGKKEELELIIEQNTIEKDTLSKEVSLQARNIEIILRRETEGEERAEARFEEEMAAWEDRLKHEGKRWVLQCDNAKDSAVRLVEQQRANHSLKGMVTSRDNSIRTLNAKVRELEAAIVELKAAIEGHEIGTATFKTEDSKSASVATVEDEGIASAEATDIKMKQELEPMDTASTEGSGEVSTLHGATQSMFGGGGERFAVDEGDEFAEKAAIDGTNANPGMLEQATATFTDLGEVEMVAEPSQEEAMP